MILETALGSILLLGIAFLFIVAVLEGFGLLDLFKHKDSKECLARKLAYVADRLAKEQLASDPLKIQPQWVTRSYPIEAVHIEVAGMVIEVCYSENSALFDSVAFYSHEHRRVVFEAHIVGSLYTPDRCGKYLPAVSEKRFNYGEWVSPFIGLCEFQRKRELADIAAHHHERFGDLDEVHDNG